jgi:hypothetical protein
MTLDVIGAGFGRTGTESLKRALERLGYAPCHHMHEVFRDPAQAQAWRAAMRGEAVDFAALLAPYRAVTDWPAAHFWRELRVLHPQARVILTVRDPQAWYASIARTIFVAQTLPLPPPDDPHHAVHAMAREVVRHGVFHDRLDDPDHVIGVYEAHNAAVRAAVPAGQLLEFDVAKGWAPLCAFLGAPVPDTPFPYGNTTEDFLARRRAREAAQRP